MSRHSALVPRPPLFSMLMLVFKIIPKFLGRNLEEPEESPIVCLSQTAEMIQQMDIAHREHRSCTEAHKNPHGGENPGSVRELSVM